MALLHTTTLSPSQQLNIDLCNAMNYTIQANLENYVCSFNPPLFFAVCQVVALLLPNKKPQGHHSSRLSKTPSVSFLYLTLTPIIPSCNQASCRRNFPEIISVMRVEILKIFYELGTAKK